MHISQITLRDWKAYTTANFDFPAPGKGRNIILIGAPNGYGKTSLFEAIVLGMFGRDGLPLIARSPFSGGDKERLATSYKTFLEKALHRGATAAGRNSCSVKLVFIDDDGEPLEIQRIWHFNDSGVYRPQDEEVHIFKGTTRKAVGPGALQGNERADWFREYIAESLLPFTLAHFFMFDGEQVSVLAEREMSAQVRAGIEGLLGIPVLKTLAKDLRSYAEVRRKDSPNVSDKTIEKLELERHQLTFEFDQKSERFAEIEPALAALKEEREHLTRELASFGAGSQALLQEQFEQITEVRQQIGQFRYLQLSDAILFNELLPPGLLLGRNLVVTRFSNNLLADMAYWDLMLVQCIRASQNQAVEAISNWWRGIAIRTERSGSRWSPTLAAWTGSRLRSLIR